MQGHGTRHTTLRTMCRKNLHPMVPNNVKVEANGARRCIECLSKYVVARQRKMHKPLPSSTGRCRANLHPWIPENILVDKVGGQRCKLCRAHAKSVYNATYLTHIPCVVFGCKGSSARRKDAPQPANYICPKHRASPPAWIESAGLHIEGTRVVE